MIKSILIGAIFVLCLNASNEVKSSYNFNSSYGFSSSNTMLANFKDARVALTVWIEKIAKSYGGKLKVTFFDKTDLMYRQFRDEKNLDMIVVDLPFYFKNKDEILSVSNNIWSVAFDENKYLQYFLIANKNSNIKDFNDIKNRTISLKQNEDSALVWLDKNSYLNYKQPYNKIVKKSFFEKKESTSLLKVFFNRVDTAIVSSRTWDTMVELNPGIKERVKILAQSKRVFLPFIGFFSKNADKNGINAFFDLSTNMNSLPESEQIKTLLKFDSIFKIDNSSLHQLEDCYNNYFKLKKEYK